MDAFLAGMAGVWDWLSVLPREMLMLPVVLIVGGVASYHDVRENRIPNTTIRWGLALGTVWCLALMALELLGWREAAGFRGYFFYRYELILIVNVGLGWLVGYALWHFDLWSAGDGKLFGVLCMLLAPGLYAEAYVPYFPGFTLFFNTFLGVFGVIVVEFAWNTVRAAFKQSSKGANLRRIALWLRRNWWENLMVAFTFLVLLLCVMQTRSYLRQELEGYLQVDQISIYLVLFLLYRPLHHLTQYPWFTRTVFAVFFGWMALGLYRVQTTPGYSLGDFGGEVFHLSGVMVFIISFSLIYHVFSPLFFQEQISPRYLKTGMVLGETTIQRLESDPDFEEHFAEHVGYLRHRPITPKSLELIREWYAHQEDRSDFFIERHIPFAPGLLAGALLTIYLRGPFF